jgi:DNA repair protein RecN (Recombination protein N)
VLERLIIENLALVERLEVRFTPGLNVITGETGAGKSLLLGSLGLLAGERAQLRWIRRGAESCRVEAVLRTPEGTRRLARRIDRNRRSAAWVDGRPVTLKALSQETARWIEPHGQAEQFRLKDPEEHRRLLDRFGGLEGSLENYREALQAWEEAKRERHELERRLRELAEKRELLEMRLAEIDRAGLEPGAKERIEGRLRLVENAQRVAETLEAVGEMLYEGEGSVAERCAQAERLLRNLASVDDRWGEAASRLEESRLVAEEVAREARDFLEGFEFDPEEFQELQDRLGAIVRLERRYGMPAEVLLEEAQRWRDALERLECGDREREEAEDREELARRRLEEAAVRLHRGRKEAAKRFAREMLKSLASLRLEGVDFRVEVVPDEAASGPIRIEGRAVTAAPDGPDRVRFFFRPNRGEAEGPVDEIASTGELSRLALAIKSLPGWRERRVVVADEVDLGVGADVACAVGERLRVLARNGQVLCITHMPQIAAMADRHLVVRKEIHGGRTRVRVDEVSGRDRLEELARMLGEGGTQRERLALAESLLRHTNPESHVRP